MPRPIDPPTNATAKIRRQRGGRAKASGVTFEVDGKIMAYVTSTEYMDSDSDHAHLLLIGSVDTQAEADQLIEDYHNPPAPVV